MDCEHLIQWKAQRIGVMSTKVTASSPSSSTVVSREASNRLNIKNYTAIATAQKHKVTNLILFIIITHLSLLVCGSLWFFLLTMEMLKSIQRRMLTMKMAMKGLVKLEISLRPRSSCIQISAPITRQMPKTLNYLQQNSIFFISFGTRRKISFRIVFARYFAFQELHSTQLSAFSKAEILLFLIYKYLML